MIWVIDKYVRVSRAAYEEYIGPIPEGLNVLHSCDNPPCFNPVHLFAGTQSDNIKDSVAKGRWPASGHKKFCKNGHPKDYLGACTLCIKLYKDEYYDLNRDELLAYARKRDRRKVKE